MGRKQDKQRELELFDVQRDHAYDLLDDAFYRFVEDRLHRYAPSAMTGVQKVLEAGCGTGAFGRHFVEALKGQADWNVTGVDLAPAMVEWNRQHPMVGYESRVGDLEDETLFPPATFDVVLCPMVLHHFPSPSKTIENLVSWLKPGGTFYIMEPNGSSPVHKLSKFIRHVIEKVMGLDYAKRFATVNETDHSMKCYVRELTTRGCEISYREARRVMGSSELGSWIGWVRHILYKITSVLPQPYHGNLLLVIARKKP